MNFKNYLVICIFVSAFLLRIYHANQLFFWHIDEDIIALTVKRIIVEYHIQLIGFPIPGGIYLGPLFYYLISVFYFVSRMNPFGLPFFTAILGATTTFLVYKVGSTIFENKNIGYFSGIVFAFSFLANVYSKVFTGLTFGPIYVLLVYLFLYRNIKNKKSTNLIPLGFVLILCAQNEGSSFSLLALVFVSLLIFKVKLPRKDLITVFVAFVIFHLPLLIFDLRHNFFLARSFLAFFSKPVLFESKSYSLDAFFGALKLFPTTLSRMIYIPPHSDIGAQIHPCLELAEKRLTEISPIATYVSVLVIAYFVFISVYKKAITTGQKIVFLHLLILLVGLLAYNLFQHGYLYEWILVIFLPGFAFVIGYFLNNLWQKKVFGQLLVISFLIIFIFVNSKATLTSTGKFGLNDKAEATRWAAKSIGEKPFYLDSLGSCFNYGYVYLFWYFGKQPATTYADYMFAPTFYKLPKASPSTGVVMVNPSQVENIEFWKKYAFYKDKIVARKQFTNIEVLIVDDRK